MSPSKGRPRKRQPAKTPRAPAAARRATLPVPTAGIEPAELRGQVERLLDSEARYRALFEQAADAIGISDREARLLEVNEAACRMSGYSREELLAMRAQALFVPGETEARPLAIEEALRGEIVCRERRMRCKDGRALEVETNTRGLPDGRVITIVRDLTPRRRAEAAKRESEERYRVLVEQASDGITITGPDWRFLEVNPRFGEMLGYSPAELLRMSVRDVGVPEDLAREPLHTEALAAGARILTERHLRCRDGSVITTEISARGLPDGTTLSVVRDVTERKRAERELRASEERLAESEHYLERAEALAHIGTWDADLATMTATYSSEMLRIHGLPPDANPVSYAAFIGSIHPDDRERVEQSIRRAMGRPGEHPFSHRVLRADGTVRIVEATARTVLDASGRPTRIIGSVQDVTERRLLELQLREAQRLEAIGRLAGGVAHDFNNLLTVILGFSEALVEGLPAGDERRASAEQIRAAGRRAAGLTQQLLAFGRQQVFRLQVFDLNAALTEMRDILQRLIGERIEIAVSPDAARCLVRADRGQIEQVVLNLALNARDAMPAGGRLGIATRNVEPPSGESHGPWLELAVSDTGTGMSPEVQAHIFEPFFTTKEVGQGTGLGLATAHGIVSQSGGRIEVSSAPGGGTTFRVLLPCAERAAEPEEAAPPASESGGSETVLLVEDEEAVRRLIAEVLRRRGYQVIDVADGDEAIEASDRHHGALHLLITDLVMPGMNGRELARFLVHARPGLRVLFVSGYSDQRAQPREGRDAGEAFLQKPFSPVALARLVRQILDAPAPGAAPAPGPSEA